MTKAVESILNSIETENWPDAFEIAEILFQKAEKMDYERYKLLLREFVSRPKGFDENEFRDRFCVHLRTTFRTFQDTETSSSAIPQKLLDEDFVPQKSLLHLKKRKHNFILLQGTPDCGLRYFVLWKHQSKCSFTAVKADTMSGIDNEIEFWDEFVKLLDLGINVHTTKKDIPSTVALKVEERLKEKPVVLIVYNIEFWQSNCKDHLDRMTKYLAKLPLEEEVTHGFYCYFVHTGGTHFADCDENLIVLPPVSELEEREVRNLYYNHVGYFEHCKEEAKVLFSGRKKLSQVIDVFIKHSSCGQEIASYLDRQLTF